MDKIAFITSGFEPVPAVKGGAVEELTTLLIDQNEDEKKFKIDLYTISDRGLEDLKYANTNIIQIRVNKLEHIIEKCINKLNRIWHSHRQFFFYDKRLKKKIGEDKQPYSYVIFENSMDQYESIHTILGDDPKYVLHMHNDFNPVSKSESMAINIANTAYRVISVSEYVSNRFLRRTGLPKEKSRVLYNCEDCAILQGDKSAASVLRKPYDIKDNDHVFLYVGRINEEKGVRELAEAYGRINGKNTKLVICGGTWGTEFRKNQYLDSVYEALGANKKNTIFTGYVDKQKMSKWYSIADTVVIPSICQEAFGMVMLESLYLGIPVIATKSGGMQEIANANEVDWIDIDSNIVNNVAGALQDNINYHRTKLERAKAAQQRIKENQNFNYIGYLDRFEECLL